MRRPAGAWGASVLRGAPVRRALVLQPGLLLVGVGAWAFGVSQIQRQAIGPYGVLASANAWFFLGLAALLAGMVAELSRARPRTWLLGAFLVALIVAIHATVPLLYGGTPEYAWVYKHVGVAQAFGQYHRVTDTSNIYQEWPALFTTVASISSLGNAGPLSFAAWGPVAFELADALLLLGIFRLLTGDRRLPYLAVLLYEGLIAWVGQDYLSPQAFGYLLWLGIMAIVIRWLLVPAPARSRWRFVNATRAFLLRGRPAGRRQHGDALGRARAGGRDLLRDRRGCISSPRTWPCSGSPRWWCWAWCGAAGSCSCCSRSSRSASWRRATA